jgi:hypothetical protein
MIYVDRSAAPFPENYGSERTRSEREHVLAQLAALREEDRSGEATGFLAKARQSAATGRIRARSMFAADHLEAIQSEVRPALWQLFRGKCVYCETDLDSIRGARDLYQPAEEDSFPRDRTPPQVRGSVELFRPREGARGVDGAAAMLHYAWLAFEWENTMLACAFCVRAKGNRFPVAGTRAALGVFHPAELAAEGPLLLDPCADFPLQHLVPDLEKGLLIPFDQRGATTIEVLNLNRTDLVEARRSIAVMCANRLQELDRNSRGMPSADVRALLIPVLEPMLHPSQPHLMVRLMTAYETIHAVWPNLAEDGQIQQLLQPARPAPIPLAPRMTGAVPHDWDAQADANQGAQVDFEAERARQQSYSIEDDTQLAKAAYFTSAKRIEHFTIRNFKAIDALSLPFPAPQGDSESWLMLLGENGCGKSSILQALALAMMGQEHANQLGLDASRYVRRHPGVESGEVIVDVSGVGRIRMEFSLDSPQFRIDPPDPKVLLLGYGATRLLPKAVRRESSQQTAVRILNLFDPTAPLADTEAWLMDRERVSDDQLEEFAGDLSRLLMLPGDLRICRDEGLVEVEYSGTRKVLRDMSDGFQSIIALAGDISIGVRDWWGGLREAEGVVLLDEIEVHLHPTWKISIVERLRQTCPMLSFVVTTHDPLCLKGLRPEEIIVLRRTPEETIEVITDIPQIQHLRSDEVLSSFLFDLPSTRGSGTSMAVARYATLRGKTELSSLEQQELKTLEESLERELSNAASPMQREIEQHVHNTLAPGALLAGDGAVARPAALSPEELEVRRQVRNLLAFDEEEDEP